MTYKRCSICGQEKKFIEFKVDKRIKSQISSRCKACDIPRLVFKDPRKILLRASRWRAKKKGILFNLKVEDITLPTKCPVLGIDLAFNNKSKNNSYSLDRIDPTKGYTKDNIQIVSVKANRMKSDASFEEIEKLYLFMKKQEENK